MPFYCAYWVCGLCTSVLCTNMYYACALSFSFSGHGATAAVELLIDCLGLKHYIQQQPYSNRPVVFIGPYEHHSNLIPWRESGCEIVMVPEHSQEKQVDCHALETLLKRYQHRSMKMGTFTAASNVTGKVCDTNRIAAVLHKHGALAFFDYATAASYMDMNMNPHGNSATTNASKDAIFLSPHKLLGGVGTPGVLVIKKHLISQSNAPGRSGGGTVFYVTHAHHRFLSHRIERYEGGTPNVPGIVRVGLAFLMKRQIERAYNDVRDESMPASMQGYEYQTYERVAAYWKEHAPNLVLLGSDDPGKKLPIFSFLIRFGDRFLHYNYVCAILNDLFGIQSRGGCQCAGPYSQKLLGLTEYTADGDQVPNKANEQIEQTLLRFKERAELLRPGFTRLSLPFKGLRSEEVDYTMKALAWISRHGWAFMCQYRCNHRTGEVSICCDRFEKDSCPLVPLILF
jgi:selenocysteine lyase/cysteine desulfurase